jgi:hypothetical protein
MPRPSWQTSSAFLDGPLRKIHFKLGSLIEMHLAARIAEAASVLLPSVADRPPGGFCR